jgi:hypothetical protein
MSTLPLGELFFTTANKTITLMKWLVSETYMNLVACKLCSKSLTDLCVMKNRMQLRLHGLIVFHATRSMQPVVSYKYKPSQNVFSN